MRAGALFQATLTQPACILFWFGACRFSTISFVVRAGLVMTSEDADGATRTAIGHISRRERALKEILSVISRSPDDEKPAFDVILRNATELCGATAASLVLGAEGDKAQRMVAERGVSPATVAHYESGAYTMDRNHSLAAEAILDGKVIHIPDMAATEQYLNGDANFRTVVDDTGIRTNLFVPLMARTGGIGVLILFRREVEPYSEEEIDLVETFAAQAVIAIENVRHFREVQERLEREKATREILSVISQSRDDETPVFETILAAAARLCDAPIARLELANEERTHFTIAAAWGSELRALKVGEEISLDLDLFVPRTMREARSFHIADLSDTEKYRERDPYRVLMVEEEGIRTYLTIPLIRDGVGIGCIVLSRREVKPFADSDIDLVQSFAAQAVIAIENVRQFREVRERLEREKASGEILTVISQSRDDERPVFDAILENALRLCDADMAVVNTANEARTEVGYAAGINSLGPMFQPGRQSWPIDSPQFVCRAILENRTFHTPDLMDTDLYRSGDVTRRNLVDNEGMRTQLVLPLTQGDRAIASFSLYRRKEQPFSDAEIALLETFAAQAVIAIENVRQFREVQERLEREKASREILDVISRSREDATPVFEILREKAQRLCGASNGAIILGEEGGGPQVLAAQIGASEETLKRYQAGEFTMDPETSLAARAIIERRTLHYDRIELSEPYKAGMRPVRQLFDNEGVKSAIYVPLISNGKGVGSINLLHKEQRTYSDDEIALVETFAAQAVIAIENVRQFRELQTRLEREAASAEVLEVISRSRDDDAPVFRTILENASRICAAPIAFLSLANDERTEVRIPAHLGTRSAFGDILEDFLEPITRTELVAVRPVANGVTVLEDDIKDDDAYRNGDPRRLQMVDVEGARSVLAVPLFRNDEPIGAIVLYRREVAPFSDDDLTLVQNFAAQAVIAIENVRQFREVQERLEREEASAEILEVISRSRDDEAPVFNTILENALRLCDMDMCSLMMVNDEETHLVLSAAAGAVTEEFEFGVDQWPLDSPQNICKSVRENRMIAVEDMSKGELYLAGDETWRKLVDKDGMRSQLVLPLIKGDRSIGSFTMFRKRVAPFADKEIAILKTFAAQAVIAIENVRQYQALEAMNAELGDRVEKQVGEIERMGRLKRFLPSQVADAVVSKGEDVLSSHRALIATLFCDIRGFTAFCERAEPEETIEVLQTYHMEMGRLLDEYGAGVEHRLGDGIMAIFNDPLPCEDPAGDALRLALAMRARMAELCKKWKRLGHRLGFGVGISFGYATVGMVGSEGRYEYTASGTSVNLAARLCDEAEDGEILLSPRAVAALEDDFDLQPRGEVVLKGIQEPVQVHRVNTAAA